MLMAVYIVLVFVAIKRLPVGLAVGWSILMAPFYILILKSMVVLRGAFVEEHAMNPASGSNSNNLDQCTIAGIKLLGPKRHRE